MDDLWPLWALLMIAVAGFTGLASYDAARGSMRDQAIAAGVACYQATSEGRSEFRWNCKQAQ